MNTSGPKKILVVDDNRHEMLTLTQILLLNGYQLSYALNESSALKLVRKTRPDLIICNAVDTKLDLAGFVKPLLSHEATRRIPILFIAKSSEQLHEQIEDLRSPHLLLKPYTREQLAISVQENLKKR
jgi:PleD family two-component response regulator